MVVVLWVVGLVVHVGSGVVLQMLAEPTLLVVMVVVVVVMIVVVLAAHLLMVTPFLQTGLVVVLWVLVASLMEGSQPSVVGVDDWERAGAGRRPTGLRALEGSQPVVLV